VSSAPFPTGVPFLDALLNGRQIPGETYGFVGPNRDDNTTVAVMLTCEAARQAAAINSTDEDADTFAVLVNYRPAPRNELRHRAISYAAAVQETSVVAGQYLPAERERIKGAVTWLAKHAIILDMPMNAPQHGYGYVAEIAAAIEKSLAPQSNKAACRCIIVNDALDVAERYAAASEKFEELLGLIRRVGVLAKSELALRYDCPVWLMNELADTPWPRRGCTWRRFTGSMQLSNFEEYLDNNIVMVPHRQDLQFRVFASRLRRPGGPDQIVRINVELNRLEDVDN
jgi:hypothetical protein